MKPQILSILLTIVLAVTTGCSTEQDKAKMFNDQLKKSKLTQSYKEVLSSARHNLQQWIADGVEEVQILKECKWKVDDAIFFNSKQDRCYLLLLMQDNAPDAEVDYVYLIYGAVENHEWKIYFSSLPNYVYMRERLKLSKNSPVPMDILSKLSREELLKGYYKNGKIDDSFVNKAYTDDIKKRHLKFLNEKQ